MRRRSSQPTRAVPLFALLTMIAGPTILVAAACGTGDAPRDRYIERDSAGVIIVENRMDTTATMGWSIEPAPLLTIGGEADDAALLYQVSGALRLADGRIVAVDGQAAQVRVFGPDGSPLTTYGRKGEGPGEFAQPSLAGRLAGDSLVVFDAGLRRATILTADTGYVRSYDVGSEGGGYPIAQGVLRDGSMAIGGGMYFSSESGFPNGHLRAPSRYVIVGVDGTVGVDLGEHPAADLYAKSDGSTFSAVTVPFGRVTGFVATRDAVWLGTGDTWELRRYSAAGTLERIVRIDRPAIAVTGAMRNAAIEEKAAEAADENGARMSRALIEEMKLPTTVPPYELFRTDGSGNVWIGEFLVPGAQARNWTILDADGHIAGRIATPPRTLPVDIGRDYMLGVTHDELGVESLTLWRLHAPG